MEALYEVLLWVIIFALFAIGEALTVNLVSIWFAIAAFVAMIAAAIGLTFTVQIILFIAVSIVLLICTKPLVKKLKNQNELKTNADSLVGKKATAIDTFDTNNRGYVDVEGMDWLAYCDEDINAGDIVEVVAVESSKLKIRKKN